jgi:FtsZ-binding cell division protein ZapB
LSIEFLGDLEKKVEAIIAQLGLLRQENVKLKEELEKKTHNAADMEKENRALKNELESLKSGSRDQHDKLKAAAERIKGLIAKIEAV